MQYAPKEESQRCAGAFSTRGQTVEFDFEALTGQDIYVEGLKPLGGGPLTYAVLSRPFSRDGG